MIILPTAKEGGWRRAHSNNPRGLLRPQAAKASQRGVALIMTLAMLAILTIMLVAYVSTVSSDRQSTRNYGQGLKAEEVAEGGLAQIVGQLEAEITDTGSKSTLLTNAAVAASAAYSIYRPQAPSNAIPERMSLLAGISGIDTIVKVSQPGAPLFTTTAQTGANTNFASSLSTTNLSLNGRSITAAQWNRPDLVPVAGTNNFPVPNWIFVGRNGPVIPTGANLSGSLTNANAILGRYAYVVYDTSGLIDINVAGYPSAAATSAGNKGILPWVDLSQLPSSPNLDQIVGWRNQANAAGYASYVTNWSTNGFMQVASGDTTFLSRQELIAYFTTNGWTDALPYLTTFSRELNGPVWGPLTNLAASGNFAYLTNQYLPTSMSGGTTNVNPFILNPRIKTTYTNNFGIVRNAGEPLVKYRFPLDKLALLSAGTDTVDIKKYFGLVPASDYSSTYQHWIYTNPNGTGTTPTNAIQTLDAVSALGRDPDFFELLQAGILNGSLGLAGRSDIATAISPDPDASAACQIIRIGANIIDQWDADSYPTIISFQSPTTTGSTSNNFYGVEDLPYINKFIFKAWSPPPYVPYTNSVSPGTIQPSTFQLWVYFELWNPHRNLGNSTGQRPSNFRIIPTSGVIGSNYYVYIDWFDANSNVYFYPVIGNSTTPIQYSSLPGGDAITFTVKPTDFREPAMISTTLNSASPAVPTAVVSNGVAGLRLGPPDPSVPAAGTPAGNNAAVLWPPPVSGGVRPIWYAALLGTVVWDLQYQDGGGTWRTYSTFAGFDNSTAAAASPNTALSMGPLISGISTNASPTAPFYAKSDPRTQRWAASLSASNPDSYPAVYGTTNTTGIGYTLTPAPGVIDTPIIEYLPFYPHLQISGAVGPYRFDMYAVNDPSVKPVGSYFTGSTNVTALASNSYYADRDGLFRPGDADKSYAASSSPLYTGDPSRPVVLNRPFQSVGELGYAFRDMPWKTLDFFSTNSADFALLDLFSLSEGPVLAGRVNPNTASTQVLAALLSGAATSWSSGSTNTLSTGNASTVASLLHGIVTNTATGGPFLSRADLVPRFMGLMLTNNSTLSAVSPKGLKTEAEAVTRSLAESANTRTWNFLIDVIAQSGRYPPGTASPADFMVEGERRYWLHIAIDRYTGQIVDQQLEVVNE